MKRVELAGIQGYPEVSRPTVSRGSAADFERALDVLLDKPEPKRTVDVENVPDGIRFSRHAQARLSSRGVEMNAEEMKVLEHAFDELNRRGAKESLVIMGERAFVVGVPSKTVITVVDRAEALGTVFTNIDSTYVAS